MSASTTCIWCGGEIIPALTRDGRRVFLDGATEERRFAVIDKERRPPRTAVVSTFVAHSAVCSGADERPGDEESIERGETDE